MKDKQSFLKFAMMANALRFGDFTLKSGRKSPYFFNAGFFNTGKLIERLGYAYAETIPQDLLNENTVIYGPAYKGIPISVAVAIALCGVAVGDIGYAFNRKEAKSYGDGGIIIGHDLADKDVILVDDVITDGASKHEAVDIIKENGGNPVACILALDRQEVFEEGNPQSAVQAFTEKTGVPVYSVVTFEDLIPLVMEQDKDKDSDNIILQRMMHYKEQYGVKAA